MQCNSLYFRTIEKHADKLDTLYAKWKIQAPLSTPTEPPTVESGLGNAELALIILGSVVGLLLVLGLCFAIKTRCRYLSLAVEYSDIFDFLARLSIIC